MIVDYHLLWPKWYDHVAEYVIGMGCTVAGGFLGVYVALGIQLSWLQGMLPMSETCATWFGVFCGFVTFVSLTVNGLLLHEWGWTRWRQAQEQAAIQNSPPGEDLDKA